MSLAARLQEMRQNRGQSLQQVADAVGVSKAHIWELERGKSANPGVELLARLAAHFSVSIAFLVGEDTEIRDPAAMQFFREFEGKLSGKDWEVLRMMAERIQEPKK